MTLKDFTRIGYGVRTIDVTCNEESLYKGDVRKLKDKNILSTTVTSFGVSRGVLEIEVEIEEKEDN